MTEFCYMSLPCMSHFKLLFSFQQMFGKEIIKKLFSKYQITIDIYTIYILKKVSTPHFIHEVTDIEDC